MRCGCVPYGCVRNAYDAYGCAQIVIAVVIAQRSFRRRRSAPKALQPAKKPGPEPRRPDSHVERPRPLGRLGLHRRRPRVARPPRSLARRAAAQGTSPAPQPRTAPAPAPAHASDPTGAKLPHTAGARPGAPPLGGARASAARAATLLEAAPGRDLSPENDPRPRDGAPRGASERGRRRNHRARQSSGRAWQIRRRHSARLASPHRPAASPQRPTDTRRRDDPRARSSGARGSCSSPRSARSSAPCGRWPTSPTSTCTAS